MRIDARCRAAALVLVLALVCAPGDLRAGEPTDQIRAEIERLARVTQQGGGNRTGDREAAEIVDRMFDWTRMSQAALGEHWQERTSAERAHFARLFGAVFRRAYVSRIHLVDVSSFRYRGDVEKGDRATVKTTVVTRSGSPLDVDYVVHRNGGGRWRVEDVRVESISLVENYRAQFDAFIARASYGALVKKLQDMAS